MPVYLDHSTFNESRSYHGIMKVAQAIKGHLQYGGFRRPDHEKLELCQLYSSFQFPHHLDLVKFCATDEHVFSSSP